MGPRGTGSLISFTLDISRHGAHLTEQSMDGSQERRRDWMFGFFFLVLDWTRIGFFALLIGLDGHGLDRIWMYTGVFYFGFGNMKIHYFPSYSL